MMNNIIIVQLFISSIVVILIWHVTYDDYVSVQLFVSYVLHISIIVQSGWSALMTAADEGHTEVGVELVKAGANKDLQDEVCH